MQSASWKMNLLNWVFRKSLDDMKYRQFAVVARKIDGAGNIECKHGQSTFTPVRKLRLYPAYLISMSNQAA